MLIEFSVKNFRSFKDKVTLSLEPINEYSELSKTTAIYGANAAGKTNLMKAFTSAILIIRKSNIRQIGEPLLEICPFEFDEISKFKPSEFEFIFYANEAKYEYSFVADKEKIYNEYLYKFNQEEREIIFERNNVNEYKFLQEDEEILNNIKTKNMDNKLFLATATTWNYEKTKDAYIWFANYIDTYNGGEFLNDFSIEKLGQNDNELREFTLNLLNQADIIIDDFNMEIKENDNIISTEKGLKVQMPKLVKIEMIHNVKDENGDIKKYNIDFKDESLGTIDIFAIAPILKDAFERGRVIIIDEIERSLHPLLVEMIVRLFNNPEVNVGNAQLIFCTHDTNLLSLDILKRDQIWFVEKNPEKGTTDLYSLVDFPVQENENIQGKYLNGRYGAIPFVVTGSKLWGENKEEDMKSQ